MKGLTLFAALLFAIPAYAQKIVPQQMECRKVGKDTYNPKPLKPKNEMKIGGDLVCGPAGQDSVRTQRSLKLNNQPSDKTLVPKIDVPLPPPVKTAFVSFKPAEFMHWTAWERFLAPAHERWRSNLNPRGWPKGNFSAHRIVYAPDRATAESERERFLVKWKKLCPGVAASLEEAGEELLTFYQFPESQHLSLRTTNIIERMQQEFRRRVKTQAALPSEGAVLRVFFGLWVSTSQGCACTTLIASTPQDIEH